MKELALHIMDIAQNSITAKATIVEIVIIEDMPTDRLEIGIKDNGVGMTHEMLLKVTDPYTTSRTTRRVGMGIPLLKDACTMAGGQLFIESVQGVGTTVTATFVHSHLDRQPLGDLAGVVTLLVSANPNIEFQYTHTINGRTYIFDTRELKEVLGSISVSNPEVVQLIRGMIRSNLEEL